MKTKFFLLLTFVLPFTQSVNKVSYTNQGRDWSGLCQTGLNQSPIDILTETKIV